jgi:hypothetical protein
MDELQPDNETLLTWWQQSLDNDTASFGCINAALFNGLYRVCSLNMKCRMGLHLGY